MEKRRPAVRKPALYYVMLLAMFAAFVAVAGGAL